MSASSFAAKLIEVKQETRSNKTSHQEDSCAHLDAVFKMFEISNASSQTILNTIDQAEFKIGIKFRWEIIIARYTMAFWFMFSDNLLRLRILFSLFVLITLVLSQTKQRGTYF